MDPLTIARLWLMFRPIRFLRNRRRAKHGLPPLEDDTMPEQSTVTMADGRVITKTEPIIPARVSTKLGVTGVVGVVPIVQGIQELHFMTPWLESFVHSSLFAQLATLAGAYLVARFTKSPSDGGLI
jgi:hypothetical protein